jgi:dual specificity phosphatase 3
MRQAADVKHQGITLVIDLRKEWEDSAIWNLYGIPYLHLPTDDAYGWHIPTDLFDQLVERAVAEIKDGGKVLVHCHMGINRGPSGAFAVLLALGMEAAEAFDLIREVRPIAYIDYAEDALLAHLQRERIPTRQAAAEMQKFRKHVNVVMTPEIKRGISHQIRQNHIKDAQDMLGVSD